MPVQRSSAPGHVYVGRSSALPCASVELAVSRAREDVEEEEQSGNT